MLALPLSTIEICLQATKNQANEMITIFGSTHENSLECLFQKTTKHKITENRSKQAKIVIT